MEESGAPPPPPQRFSARADKEEGTARAAGTPTSAPDAQAQQQQQAPPSPSPLPIVLSSAAAASAGPAPRPPSLLQQVPDCILNDPLLRAAKSVLPPNYNFEVEKTVWRVRQITSKQPVVALQLPEGLLMFALALADVVERFGGAAHVLVLGDVTYGACCVDDLSARALGCDLLVHYGHSCLVPVGETAVPCMYVFVDIAVDVRHLVETVRLNFPPVLEAGEEEKEGRAADGSGDTGGRDEGPGAAAEAGGGPAASSAASRAAAPPSTTAAAAGTRPVRRLALAGTIQFSGAVAAARAALLLGGGGGAGGGGGGGVDGEEEAAAARRPYPPGSIVVPKARPLSPGEVLGCTAPKLPVAVGSVGDGGCCGGGGGGGGDKGACGGSDKSGGASSSTQKGAVDALVFVADGRFHLEAIMIANPSVPAYRYDPYARALTRERYDHRGMRAARRRAVEAARAPGARWGVVLGTLGRQGNTRLMRLLQLELARAGEEEEGEEGAEAGEEQAGDGAAPVASSSGRPRPPRRPVLAATVLLSEVTPAKLAMIGHVDVWAQVACPRLSIDWGEGFAKPMLTPYEALVALGRAPAPWWDDGEIVEEEEEEEEEEGEEGEEGREQGMDRAAAAAVAQVSLQPSARREERRQARVERRRAGEDERARAPLGDYPMDYYAADGGEWSSTYHRRPAAGARAAALAAAR